MLKKELLKMSKKRIFKDFLKEAKQHRPIVFHTDNDCDGMLASSVLMSVCYRLGIKDFFFFSPLRNTHGYGFTDLAINDLLSKPFWGRIWSLTHNCKKSYYSVLNNASSQTTIRVLKLV